MYVCVCVCACMRAFVIHIEIIIIIIFKNDTTKTPQKTNKPNKQTSPHDVTLMLNHYRFVFFRILQMYLIRSIIKCSETCSLSSI